MYSRKTLAWSLAVATLIACLGSWQALTMSMGAGDTATRLRYLSLPFLYLYSWAFQIPLLARFFGRYPLSERPSRSIPLYVGVGIMASIGPASLNRALNYFVTRSAGSGYSSFTAGLAYQVFGSFLMFCLVAGIFQTVVARQRVRELQEQLSRAELQNLKSQLQPHFLFNTLHTISVLQRQDVDAANQMLLKLSDLLRVSLDHSRTDQIPLRQELDFLEAYLSIEKTRFEERLRITIDADAEARCALIPTLLLQPLVENAVRHGIGPRAAGGDLNISARRNGSTLELFVEDNGSGLAADFADRRTHGCGLRNTEERLRALYGDKASLQVAARSGGGVSVNVFIPYKQA
jgi:two-component system, LytTR family, sensor kinase